MKITRNLLRNAVTVVCLTALFTVVFTGCDDSIDDKSGGNNTLKIKNRSSYEITEVYSGYESGTAVTNIVNTIAPGKETTLTYKEDTWIIDHFLYFKVNNG